MQALDRIEQLPIDDALSVVTSARGELFRDSLYLFAKYLLGYKDVNTQTHGRMIRVLESEKRRKLVVMPRGTFKSSISSVAYPIWQLCRNPNLRILIDSELYTNSKNFLREIKHHLQSEKLVSLFGEFRTEHTWNEGEIIIRQRNQVYKEASISCSGIGSEKTSQHFDIIIADDLNSPSNSNTPEGQEKVINHYRYFTSLLEPHGTIVLVGTRYAANDCIGFVIQNEIMRRGLL